VEFVVKKVALGQVLLQILQFPLQILIPPTDPYSSIILSLTLYGIVNDSAVKEKS
jgi:hypothetical protein